MNIGQPWTDPNAQRNPVGPQMGPGYNPLGAPLQNQGAIPMNIGQPWTDPSAQRNPVGPQMGMGYNPLGAPLGAMFNPSQQMSAPVPRQQWTPSSFGSPSTPPLGTAPRAPTQPAIRIRGRKGGY